MAAVVIADDDPDLLTVFAHVLIRAWHCVIACP
jgi:hypothetical protein